MTKFDHSNTLFQKAVSFVNQTSRHIFLTGKAGTGKTTFLKYIHDSSFKKMVIVAPTGVAAINAGGVTIHSLFQIPPGTFLPTNSGQFESFDGRINNQHSLLSQLRMAGEKRELIQELELLVIDEISMVRADLLDAMDLILRHIRRQPLLPFGGVQVIYIGDLFQLPPVVRNEEWELLKTFYKSPFFFDALVMQQTQPIYIELKKIYRQSDDVFINILNNIRNNCCTPSDLEELHKHFRPSFSPAKEENFITLTTHNDKADTINQNELNRLPGQVVQFKAEISGEFNERSYPVDQLLRLKPGAQIMFIKNDSGENRRYYNGKIGIIDSIKEAKIIISFPKENWTLELEKETWTNIRYHYRKERDVFEEEELGTFTQYPIRLAWAITIHKSQGLTFDKAIIDAGASFAAGQVYVALSRLTGMQGLILKSRISPNAIQTDQRVVEFLNTSYTEEALEEVLKGNQEEYIRFSILQGFSFDKLIGSFQLHLESFEERIIPEQEIAEDWTKDMLGRIEGLNEVGNKFQRQLERLFEESKTEGYKQFYERTSAACNYFEKEISEKLVQAVQKQFIRNKLSNKIKRYLRDLDDLERILERKKNQFVHMRDVVKAMHESGKTEDILKAMEVFHRPKTEPETELVQPDTRKKEKGESNRLSLQMFKSGKTIPQIAEERKLVISTVEAHLVSYVTTGEIDVLELVEPSKLEKILDLCNNMPGASSSTLKQQLGNEFSYAEIRAALRSRMRQREE